MSPNNITTRILLEFCEPLEMAVVLAAICYITLFTLTKLPFDAPNFVGVWAIVPLDYQIKTSRGLFVLLPAMAEGAAWRHRSRRKISCRGRRGPHGGCRQGMKMMFEIRPMTTLPVDATADMSLES